MIRIATRGSPLALIQARLAIEALARRHPAEDFVLQPIQTRGDRARGMSLTEAAQEGVFVKELEQALRDGRADLAVHSAKDLPTAPSRDFVRAAFLARADARDVLVGRSPVTLATLPEGARVGTGSPRRAAQLLAARPDLRIVPIRGNVGTRLRRLQEGAADAVVLAAAGLERLARVSEIHEWLSFDVMLPAPGQGALTIQAVGGSRAAALAEAIDHPATRRSVEAERGLLRGLGGGCLTPVGAYGCVEDSVLTLRAVVVSPDGLRAARATAQGSNDAEVIDSVLAQLRDQGVDDLLREDGEPLSGLRVMVTRAREQAGDFVRALEEAGAVVVELPVITIEPVPIGYGGRLLRNLDRYEWVIFTSVNGVERFFNLLEEMEIRRPAARFAAIGGQTAARLGTYGCPAEIVPERFVAEELAASFPEAEVRGKRILIPRAAGARDVLPERLRGLGAIVDVLEVYRAMPPPGLPSDLQAQLAAGVDAITFTSSSTVRNFVDALKGVQAVPEGVRIACIGPVTAETAREAGLRVDIIAEEYTTRGLVEALVQDRVSGSART